MELRVAFLNCRGHGDCAVITFEEMGKPACIVVDGGENQDSAQALADYLEAHSVQTIDLMVGTHIDSDHINGLKHFVQEQGKGKKKNKPYIMVKEFWGPKPSAEYLSDILPTSIPETGDPGDTISWQNYVIQSVQQNDDLYEALKELGAIISHPALDDKPKMPFNSVKIELLGPDTQIPADHIKKTALGLPPPAEVGDSITTLDQLETAISKSFEQMAQQANRNANNQSIVFNLSPAVAVGSASNWTFLFTGDAEVEAWSEMESNTKVTPLLKARVLKIPHHGSQLNGITDNGAKSVSPEYSVNSVGQKHGLPDKETLELLQGLNSALLCTQRNQSSSKKSACYNVPAADCPAKGNAEDIIFILNTANGKCDIKPKNRECKHRW